MTNQTAWPESRPSLLSLSAGELTRRLLEVSRNDNEPLWPTRYADDTAECAWRFVLEQRTWNEAEGEVQPFPDLPYLECYAFEWWAAKDAGQTLVTEKCRRMVISWEARALELWTMGLRRADCTLVGEDLDSAAKHVWRLKHLYTDLQKRHPDWKLPDHSELKYEGARKLKMFGLANGSVTNYANGEDSTLRGDGTAIITMEEASTYRHLASNLAQARIITQGSAGHKGGFVNLIANTTANYEWQLVKTGGDTRR